MKNKLNCICAEFDGKGWSVCGFHCPIHNKLSQKELEKVYVKRKKMMEQMIKDIKSGVFQKKSNLLNF